MGKIISYLFIIAGLGILLYGGYELWQTKVNENKRLNEAQAFVSHEVISTIEENISDYYKNFKKGDTIGTLYIPRLDREIPIVEGTDPEELKQGVGHYSDSGYPGENRQILLSGHRDTVFRQFDQIKHGDEFHVRLENGTFIYVFQDFEIVDADDTTVIDPNRQDEYLTVSTCYPFVFVGDAPNRYVIYAYPK